MTKNNYWNDSVGYPQFIPINNEPYAQYRHTISTEKRDYRGQIILLPKSKGVTTSIKQSQILEYDVNIEEFEKSGFKIANLFISRGNRCSKTGYVQKCEVDKAVNFKPHYCGDPINCPICARARAKSNGRRLFHTLLAGTKHYIAHLVLTVPDSHPRGFQTLESRQEVYEWLYEQAKKFMDGHLKNYPYVAVVHSWASKNPLEKPHWHIHILVDLMKICNGKIIFGSGYRQKRELDGFRKTWSELIDISFKKSNVYWEYIESDHDGKLRHWCNYICRTGILDVNTFLMTHGDVDTLTDNEQEWYSFHIEPVKKRFRRVRWFGGLSDSTKRSWLLKIQSHIDLVNEAIRQDILESKRLFCWCCGAELDPSSWEWNKGLIPRQYFARSNDSWNGYKALVS